MPVDEIMVRSLENVSIKENLRILRVTKIQVGATSVKHVVVKLHVSWLGLH